MIVNINSGGWKIATKRRVDCVGKYWRWLSWQVEGGESWVQWAPAALWFSCQCTCCSPQCTCCSHQCTCWCSQPPESKWWNYFAMPEGIWLSRGWSQTTVKRAFGRFNDLMYFSIFRVCKTTLWSQYNNVACEEVNCPTIWSLYCQWGIELQYFTPRSQRNIVQQCIAMYYLCVR